MRWLCSLLLLVPALCAQAGAPVATFTENRGQWPAQVLYRVLLPNGALFVERDAFTYALSAGGDAHQHGATHPDHAHEPYRAHAFKVHFEGGNATHWSGASKAAHYENHFIGNDPAQWGTGCGVFAEVTLHDVWPGIDLHIDGRTGLKYEFLLDPGVDPNTVRMRYEGHDGVSISDDRLVVKTTAGDVLEEAPYSFYADDEERSDIASTFKADGDQVVFVFPDGTDPARPLVIDPTLSFASYSGSAGDNFGFTATYDLGGHLYGGGIVFNTGYPTTLGAWDGSFNDEDTTINAVDVGVSKWTVDGSSLIWSTYIGGSSSEAPHSMVVNQANELFILGHTGSSDFPTTSNCFQSTFSGGPALSFTTGYGFSQPNGTDIFVVHLDNAATGLIGSTFVGGSGNDGVNNDVVLAHNYGDAFRGEIILDEAEHPMVASVTASANMTTINAVQSTYGGGTQDGFCFRLDPTLNTLEWATYLGGSGADAAFGIQVDQEGDLFTTGGTTSSDLPMYGTPFKSTISGTTDGFIMRYSEAGAALSSTFIGTNSFDQCYFVQLDTEDAVYVVGQSNGPYPVTTGKYSVPGSSQFIHKLSNDLSISIWSTVFGNGSPLQYLSPTAFLVSNCGQIYFSGWGGGANINAGNTSSTTTGMETTPNCFQPETDGRDLYLMVLNPDAVSLNYATFFGGASGGEHVDGGTSRFNKDGTIYQAVCAGCGSSDDFPTTPGAWSNVNPSNNCNLGVFKFDLSIPTAEIGIDGPTLICIPGTVQFTNTSTGGDTYLWDFGDGSTSAEFVPAHLYQTEGVFTVTMTMTDSYGCTLADTADIEVTAIDVPIPLVLDPGAICPGDSTQLFASDGLSWSWFPPENVSDPTIQAPYVDPPEPMSFSVIVESVCGFDTATVFVPWITPVGSAGNDVNICAGSGVALQGSGGGTYLWSPAATLSDPSSAAPIASPLDTTEYSVIITTPDGCLVFDTLLAKVYTDPPIPVLVDTAVCAGGSIQLIAPEGGTFAWLAGPGIQDLFIQDPIVAPPASTWYVVTVDNGCGTIRDSAFVEVRSPIIVAGPDTLVCPDEPVQLYVTPGISYAWSPAQYMDDADAPDPIATVPASTIISVDVSDPTGCIGTATLLIDTYPVTPVTALWEQVIELGQTAQLIALGDGTFAWTPSVTLSDSTSATPVAEPEQTTTYTVSMTDENGCVTTDDVTIIIPGSLFIPNTFTPNSDGYNDAFGAWGVDIVEIELEVYDRWGKMIWTTADLRGRWDGTYGGQDAPIDTYVWRVRAKEIAGEVIQRTGHVTLVR
ncbi:MAG TPA: gliding motility-associated C-terminal domain-containing protein [Flavobacteriales bacterium]|nr:gliding motility-associated C-terminal domain-containing protein [Flavobacteriales bacterium]